VENGNEPLSLKMGGVGLVEMNAMRFVMA